MHDGHGAHADAIDNPPAFPLGAGLSAGASRLSPAAVRNQVFTVVRLREGYDLAEVDTFLSRVETAFTMLLQENAELRAQAIAAERARPAEEGAAQIMTMAQDSANRVLAAADQQAQAILAQARDRTVVSPQENHAPCREELERRVEEFDAFIADYSHRLKHGLQAQVGRLQNLLDEFTTPGDTRPTTPSQPQPMATGRHPAQPMPQSADPATEDGGSARGSFRNSSAINPDKRW